VIQDREKTGTFSRVCGKAEEGVAIGLEQLVKESLGTQTLRRRGLGSGIPEKEIVLCEPRLDGIRREVLLDIAESAAAITGVDIDTLA
jgi:hypothetical protein